GTYHEATTRSRRSRIVSDRPARRVREQHGVLRRCRQRRWRRRGQWRGMCGSSCTGGLKLCDGTCTDTTKAPKNCGACDAPCMAPMNATASCASSKCSYACTPGWVDLADGGMVVEAGTNCNYRDTATATDPDKPDTSFQDTNCDG